MVGGPAWRSISIRSGPSRPSPSSAKAAVAAFGEYIKDQVLAAEEDDNATGPL